MQQLLFSIRTYSMSLKKKKSMRVWGNVYIHAGKIDGQNDKHSSRGAEKCPSLQENWQKTKHRRRLLGNGW